MKLTRLFQRLFFYPTNAMINFVGLMNDSTYKKLKPRFLKAFGMHINGRPLYIAPSVKFDDFTRITLSQGVVISRNVYFLTHDYSRLIAYNAMNVSVMGVDDPHYGDIIINENVFIGANSFIMPGVQIGKNSIIGAGTIVRGSIPENSVVIGNPCQIIGNTLDFGMKWLSQQGYK